MFIVNSEHIYCMSRVFKYITLNNYLASRKDATTNFFNEFQVKFSLYTPWTTRFYRENNDLKWPHPFHATGLFLYSLKTCFQGVQKETSAKKWVYPFVPWLSLSISTGRKAVWGITGSSLRKIWKKITPREVR